MNYSGHDAGVQQGAVAPHSTAAALRTAPASSSAAARVGLLDARRASLALSQRRVVVPDRETAKNENQDGRRSEMKYSGHNVGEQQDVVAPHFTTQVTAEVS